MFLVMPEGAMAAPTFELFGRVFCTLMILLLFSDKAYTSKFQEDVNPLEDCNRPSCYILDQKRHAQQTVHESFDDKRQLTVFCFRGVSYRWLNVWVNPVLKIVGNSPQPNLDHFYGRNYTDVKRKFESSFFNIFNVWKVKEEYTFDPFNASCYGISSDEGYEAVLKVKNPDIWFVAFLLAGIVVFCSAKSWSRNTTLHYGTGISLGVLASCLVLIFLLSRLLPQKLKTVTYGVLLIGGSVTLWALQTISDYAQDILENHWKLALGYVVVTGIVSFGVVYRYGPITDARSLNLVKWTLQLAALISIFKGTQIPEISLAIILLVLTAYNFPGKYIINKFGFLKKLWHKLFPLKIRLLTEEEYIQQGNEETIRALNDLREYCRSPNCDAWKVVSRITSPSRFASFVEGESHVSDTELLEHDASTFFEPPYDSDDDDSSY